MTKKVKEKLHVKLKSNSSNRKSERKCTLKVNGEWERQEEIDMVEGKAKEAMSNSATVATSSYTIIV